MQPELRASAQPAQLNEPLLDRTVPADFRWVRRVIHEALEVLKADGQSAAELDTIEIVLAEALNNVVEHAYEGQDEPGDVTLLIKKRRRSLIFEIRDRGRPMPNGRAPTGNHPMTEFDKDDAMPEGGYGWFLIRELVLDLIYDRKNGENILFMTLATGNE